MVTRLRVLFAIFWVAMGVGACDADRGGSAENQLPVLRITSDATFAPFHFVDNSGEPTGFELELAKMVAERAGYVAAVSVIEYDDLLPGLTRGDHDLVAATTGVTDERKQSYAFTESYFQTCQALLVRSGSEEPDSISDLDGLTVGAAGSGTSALALTRFAASERLILDKGQASVPALEDGTIDALIVDEYDAVEAARSSGGELRVLAEPAATEDYAFVLGKGREELVAKLDDALAALRREGQIDALQIRFGVSRDDRWPVLCEASERDEN